jgi:general secretion pathway protein C
LFSGVVQRFRKSPATISPAMLQAAATVGLVGVLAVQVALLVWAVLVPLGPVGDWRPAIVSAVAKLPGDTTSFDPFFRLQSTAPTTAVVTSLALKLFGTRIDSAMGRGSAIIATPDGIQSSYGVGDEIVPGVKLKQVSYDNVTIDRGGVDEQLFLDQSVAAAVVSPQASVGAPTSLTDLSTAKSLQGSIDAAPRMNGGALTGLTLRPKGDGELFRAAGLESGDVLTAINGKPLTGLSDVSQMTAGADGTVSLQVERAGRTMTLSAKTTP